MTPRSPDTEEPAAEEPARSDPADRPSSGLPAELHAVVFFDAPGGREHIDTLLRSDATTSTLSGVHADESRAHPVSRRVTLTAEERAEYARLVAAVDTMPRCEPLARFPGEPTWAIDFDQHSDVGPSLWFRDNGALMLRSTDPCLAYVRLAHFVYATWAERIGL